MSEGDVTSPEQPYHFWEGLELFGFGGIVAPTSSLDLVSPVILGNVSYSFDPPPVGFYDLANEHVTRLYWDITRCDRNSGGLEFFKFDM